MDARNVFLHGRLRSIIYYTFILKFKLNKPTLNKTQYIIYPIQHYLFVLTGPGVRPVTLIHLKE